MRRKVLKNIPPIKAKTIMKIKVTLLWLVIIFGYLWAGVMIAAGNVFDAMVMLLLTAILQFNDNKIVDYNRWV